MTTQAHSGIYCRFQIMCLRRSPQERDGRIFGTSQDLVGKPPLKTGPHMTRNTTDVLMGGFGPALVGRSDGVASGTELRLIGQWNRNPRQSHSSDHNGQYNRGPRRPVHALVFEWETAESRAQPHRRHRPDAAWAREDQSVCRTPPREDHRTNTKFLPIDRAPR